MLCGLVGIERACGPVIVGLSNVQMIVPAQVDKYPLRGRSGLYQTDMVLKSGANIYDIDFDPGTAGWQQDSQNTGAGDTYRNTVQLRIRKDRPAQVSFLEHLKNKRVHLILTDQDGQKHLLLNARAGVRAENGPRGGSNHYNYTFRNTDRLPVAFLSGEITTTDGNVLVEAVLQSPDGNFWRLAVGICAAPIALSTTDTDVIPANFRIEDSDGNTYELSVDNCGTLSTSTAAGTAGQILLDAPDGNTYELSVGECETLITILTGSDLPNPDDGVIGG